MGTENAAETSKASTLEREDAPNLAYIFTPPEERGLRKPIIMFCGGYRSDMDGTKATYLENRCIQRGQGYIRFDYRGHGRSDGVFEKSGIGDWAKDAQDVFDHVTSYYAGQPVVLVGSSMGGWIALLLAKARSGIVKGVVGVAAAPDFTEEMFDARLTDEQRADLMTKGVTKVANDYSDEPYIFTKEFYEEAKKHLLLSLPQNITFPIRLVQGMLDKDVPWESAVKIQKSFTGSEVDIVFVDDGDHRLSRPEDMALIDREIVSLSEDIYRNK
ncbi:MAG: alpha/beta hydrolase [Alphaproteobacteria bacterium]|nr:alpha/beta hydrolase [Alphaproteobacteria bacterium]